MADSPGSDTAPPSFFQPYEIRSATDSDFEYFIQLADDEGDGWIKKLEKNGLTIWQKETGVSSIKLAKVKGEFQGVSPGTVFDSILDGEYRRVWDENVIEDFEHCRLDDNNDVGYYSMKCPAPLKNRDFVNQRSWRAFGEEQYVIFNHSVSIKAIPLNKRFIRGISYITGFLIRSSKNGSLCTYVTQTDPKGKIPSWLINMAINKIAPSVFRKLYTACLNYEGWKADNTKDVKPWRYPEQNKLRLVDAAQLLMENGSTPAAERKVEGEEVPQDSEVGQEDDELPEDEEAMKEIADKIAEKLDAETSSDMVANGNSNGDVVTEHDN